MRRFTTLLLLLLSTTLSADQGIQAVIFDWAGTTVDFGCMAPASVFQKVFEEEGVTATVTQARGPMGLYKRDHLKAMVSEPEICNQWISVHGRAPTDSDIDRMFHRYIPLQLACIAEHAALISGAEETVSYIRAKDWKIGSTTGYTEEMVAIMTELLGDSYRPDSIVTSDMVKRGRPHPDMIWKNLYNLGAAPSRTVKVDDSIPGLIAARNAGCWAVYVAHSGNEVGLTEEAFYSLSDKERKALTDPAEAKGAGIAHYTIGTIAELPSILEEIDQKLKSGLLPFDTE